MIDALCTAPVLVLPDPTKPYVVTTDASGYALGACLHKIMVMVYNLLLYVKENVTS